MRTAFHMFQLELEAAFPGAEFEKIQELATVTPEATQNASEAIALIRARGATPGRILVDPLRMRYILCTE